MTLPDFFSQAVVLDFSFNVSRSAFAIYTFITQVKFQNQLHNLEKKHGPQTTSIPVQVTKSQRNGEKTKDKLIIDFNAQSTTTVTLLYFHPVHLRIAQRGDQPHHGAV